MAPRSVSTKRRQTPAPQDEVPESIFDALNLDPTTGKTPIQAEPRQPGPSIEDLQRQIATLNERLEAQDRAQISALASAPPVTPVAPKEPQLDLNNLPDPVADPTGYGRELVKRSNDFVRAQAEFERQQNAGQQQQAGNDQQLWDDFTVAYPDYADDPDGVEFAVTQVIRQKTRQGIDMNRYRFQFRDRFFDDVIKVYDKRFGTPEGEDGDEPMERDVAPVRKGKQPVQRRNAEPDEEALRTTGIFGGNEGNTPRGVQRIPAGDMIKDIQDIQRRSGYY